MSGRITLDMSEYRTILDRSGDAEERAAIAEAACNGLIARCTEQQERIRNLAFALRQSNIRNVELEAKCAAIVRSQTAKKKRQRKAAAK